MLVGRTLRLIEEALVSILCLSVCLSVSLTPSSHAHRTVLIELWEQPICWPSTFQI